MDINAAKHFLRNPLVAFADIKKRRELKLALLALMANRAAGVENGIQFEGVTLDKPTPETLTIVLVLREITQDRQYSIVNWPGGISLVRTAAVDNLDEDVRNVNQNANFIIRGGSDKSIDLVNQAPKPTGVIKEDGVKK
jgi:hypothetical protein